MAILYVYSGAAGTGDGSSRTNAYTSLGAALSAAVTAATSPPTQVGIYDDDSENLASATTYTAAATQAAIIPVVVISHTTGLATTLTSPITSSSGIGLTSVGYAKLYGISISLGAGTTSTASLACLNTAVTDWSFESCSVKLNNNTASSIGVGAAGRFAYRMAFVNTPLIFQNSGQTIQLYGELILKGTGTTIGSGSAVPNTLIVPQGFNALNVLAEGVDLSPLTAGSKYLFGGTTLYGFRAQIKDCKLATLPAAITDLVNGGSIASTTRIDVIRSGPAGSSNNFVEQRYSIEGRQVDETSITLTGGTTDGTTLKSRKITTSTSASVAKPFQCSDIVIWNANTTGAMTVSLQGIWDNAAVPNDNDIWIEVEYLADSGDPLGGYVSSNLSSAIGAGNALTVGTGTWANTGGMTAPKKFVLTAPSFTPAQPGFLTIRIFVAKPSVTLYVDPKPTGTISGGTFPTVSRSLVLPSGALMHETGALTAGPSVYIPITDYVAV